MNLIIFVFAGITYNLEYNCEFAYDDNIYEYSVRDLDEFTNRIRSYRFPFETSDDLVTRQDCQLLLRTRTIANRTTTINLRAAASNHAINRQKDYQTYNAGIRQSFGKIALKCDYLHIPRYLIKYYPDPMSAEYKECAFTEHLLTLKTSFLPSEIIALHVRAAREWDNYVPDFRVYDTQAWRIGADLDLAMNPWYEPAIGYEFKDALSRGPDPDLSFRRHSGSINNLFNLRFPRLAKLYLDYKIDYRIYTTDLPPAEDTPHSGRTDFTHRFACAARIPVLGFLDITGGYCYEFRRASSPSYPEIGIVKNYDKYQLSGGIRFSY